jgi:hypothetical protein
LLPLVLVAWAAAAFGDALGTELGRWWTRDVYAAPPIMWRLGAPRAERLARCLTVSAKVLPPDARVAVHTVEGGLYTWRWSAYALPAHDVVPKGGGMGAPPPAYLVTVATEPPPAGRRLRGGRWCAVFALP